MCYMKKMTIIVAGLAVFVALDVEDVSAQVASEEVYQLSTVAGNTLPTVIEENGDCRDEIVSASLTLGTDGHWTLTTEEREACGNESAEETDEEDGTYHVEGETIHFMDDDGDPLEADDDATELEIDLLREGTRTENGLRVVIADEDTVLEFTR